MKNHYLNFSFISLLLTVWAESGDFRDAPHSHHNPSMDHNQVSTFLHVRNSRMRDRKGNTIIL